MSIEAKIIKLEMPGPDYRLTLNVEVKEFNQALANALIELKEGLIDKIEIIKEKNERKKD